MISQVHRPHFGAVYIPSSELHKLPKLKRYEKDPESYQLTDKILSRPDHHPIAQRIEQSESVV